MLTSVSNDGFRTGSAFGRWFATEGRSGMEPPQEIKDLYQHWQELLEAPTDDERIAAGRRIAQQWDE